MTVKNFKDALNHVDEDRLKSIASKAFSSKLDGSEVILGAALDVYRDRFGREELVKFCISFA